MNELLRSATCELSRFLDTHLPAMAADWWSKHVVSRLSFQQQRMVQERGHSNLKQLDFAALLRVLDQNWHEISDALNLPREGRTWVKELQTVRNKWAHLSAEGTPPSELFRDADTLGRLLKMIGASETAVLATEEIKANAVTAMAGANPWKIKSSDPAPSPASESRSLFNVGDLVALRSNPATILPVIEVVIGGAECRYRVFQNNAKVIYYESQLQVPAAVTDASTTLTAHELQARVTSLQILSPSTANLFSLRSGRVQFVPYQYRPVLKLIRSDRPRLLVADEVGVGKTIEAGLIIKELRARMDLSSVLIICPKALVAERKWFLEMKRFDETFVPLDSRLLRHCFQETDLEGEWPNQYAKAILPFSLFDSDMVLGGDGPRARKEHSLLGLDPPPKFDLIIVDEAHHIRNPETFLHQGIRFFCDNAEAVIFLSATPVQLGSKDLYTLLNVLRPDLIIDHASFQQMAEPNRHINMAVHHCRAAQPGWPKDARAALDEVAQTEWGRLFLRESPSFQKVYDQLQNDSLDDASRIGLTRAIEEMYTFGSLINRTRRRDIGNFTTRKPETQSIEFTAAQKSLHDDLLELIARILLFCHGEQNIKFMMTTIRRQAASCIYGLAPLLKNILSGKLDRLELIEAGDGDEDPDFSFVERVRTEIAALVTQAENLDPHDPKVEAFCKTLTAKSRLPNSKALVFSTFRHTLAYLAQHTERAGLRFGLIHGDIPDDERAVLRRRFALPKDNPDAIDILLSSEVGCEGLDFQFCDCVINYDLPWNPMRIEQRIGRVDRHGQKSETVAIINFITPGTVDADIYDRCLMRIGVFNQSIGGSEEILGEITQELHDIAESFNLTPEEREARLQQLADNKLRRVKEEQDLESKQGELFGLNLPRQPWREEIAAAESFWLSPPALQRCVACYLASRSGSDAEHLLGEKPLKTLRLSQEARTRLLEDFRQLSGSHDSAAREWEKWLKGNQPTLAVTFDADAAAEDTKLTHLTVLHPLVRQAARFLQVDEPVRATLRVHSSELPAGSYPFALYRWKMQGVKQDESLVPVTTDDKVEAALLNLLQSAVDAREGELPFESQLETLDSRHHLKWSAAQANHIAMNRESVDHRIQSLTVSHRARCKAIADQIARASNEKIQLMKQSELARAHADFNRRIEELQRAANSGDIHATAVVFGTITVERENAK